MGAFAFGRERGRRLSSHARSADTRAAAAASLSLQTFAFDCKPQRANLARGLRLLVCGCADGRQQTQNSVAQTVAVSSAGAVRVAAGVIVTYCTTADYCTLLLLLRQLI